MTESRPPADEPWLEVYSSADFASWLGEQQVSVAISTYQTAKLFLIGRKSDGHLIVHERTFNRCMGLWAAGETMWLSSAYQLWRFVNVLRPGQLHQGCDRLYVPRTGHTTGDLDVHDLAEEEMGRIVFINTKFSCLATLDDRASFQPLWRPPFISKLAPEDRCHLNGLALESGRARYVTACSTSDVADGWRERRHNGGVVLDLRGNAVVSSGLSMPHSPRVYCGRLWLLNSGTGFFGWVDPERGTFEPVTFCPGYLRGLAFTGDYALVGLSRARHDPTFGGLPLQKELEARNAEPRCGVHVIDLRSGDVAHWLRLGGMVSELYDVAVLPGVAQPMALGFKTDEVQRLLTIGDEGAL
ncbi:MAG TPA: TIGR03032 family protein [Gemmataceae bacterium]|nr:TIGR03032 family protein [Gemmataceae bacterium]